MEIPPIFAYLLITIFVFSILFRYIFIIVLLYRTCNDCMQDLFCGYCYQDQRHTAVNSSCLPTTYDNPWVATRGRCNSTDLKGDLTWAYDYCPTDFSWMPMIGLVLYLMFFAPGMSMALFTKLCGIIEVRCHYCHLLSTVLYYQDQLTS